jgi:hypothetical protein
MIITGSIRSWAAIFTVVAMFSIPAIFSTCAEAQGKSDFLTGFRAHGRELDIGTYTPTSEGKTLTVAMIGITDGDQKNVVMFTAKDWDKLLDLWNSARESQTPEWHTIGDLPTVVPANSSITVVSGPGIRFIIQSQQVGAFTFDLTAADMSNMNAALQRAKSSLSGR